MTKKITLLLIVGISLLLHSCYYDVESELYPGSCDVPLQLTYTDQIKPIIDASCATSGCHVSGGNGPGNFSSYPGIQPYLDDGTFNQLVVIDQVMPPSSSLSSCQLQFINQWILNGALE